MLVLSRRLNQRILFPSLGITVQILQNKGTVVKVGIEAPDDVPVYREEALSANQLIESLELVRGGFDRHALRNQLNAINLKLHLVQKQLERGLTAAAEQTLVEMLQSVSSLDQTVSQRTQSFLSFERSETPPETQQDASSRRLLVVEDDDNERELLAGLLKLSGFQVETVADGSEALSYLSRHRLPDALLLDMNLPRVNGFQTLRAIRGDLRTEKIKVFAVSGSNPPVVELPCGLRGLDGWFSKPLDPARLIQGINTGSAAVVTSA